MLSKKMSVPVGLSSSVLQTHNPLQMSRSVPNYISHHNRSPGSCSSSNKQIQTSSHRKLTRARVIQPAEILQERQRRERARSASALLRQDLDNHHGGKRQKQDFNRNIWNA